MFEANRMLQIRSEYGTLMLVIIEAPKYSDYRAGYFRIIKVSTKAASMPLESA